MLNDIARLLIWSASGALSVGHGSSPSTAALKALQTGLRGKSGPLDEVRLIVHCAQACGLLSSAGRWLVPSPDVMTWLAASATQKRSALFRGAVWGQGAARAWAASRLPGWRLAQHLPSFLAVLSRSGPNRARDIQRRLVARTAEVTLSRNPASSIEAFSRSLADLVARLRASGDAGLFTLSITYDRPARADRTAVLTQTLPLVDALNLAPYGDPSALLAGHVHIQRASLSAAISRGYDVDGLTRLLAGYDLPLELSRALKRWRDTASTFALRTVTVLETRKHEDMQALLNVSRVRACIERSLSPRAVVVRETHLGPLVKRLQRERGLLGGFVDLVSTQGEPVGDPLADDAVAAHMYLAACVAQRYPDMIPVPYRLPAGVAQQIGAGLPSRIRTAIEQTVAGWARDPAPPNWDALSGPNVDALTQAERASLMICQRAIAEGRGLQLTYSGLKDRTPVTRMIEPIRIEWRGPRAYLRGYDEDAGDERSFRIDRMVDVMLGALLLVIGPITRRRRLPARAQRRRA